MRLKKYPTNGYIKLLSILNQEKSIGRNTAVTDREALYYMP